MKNDLTIVLTGGGTGGHITPILAVAHELKRLRPDSRLVYIGERNNTFAHRIKDNPDFDAAYGIFAGKFRRYHGESWLKRLFAVHDHVRNLRDAIYVCIGMVQSWFLLGKLKPRALFQKGGYVGMPVGLAAAARKIPFLTHDSDIVPGLANRVVSRWATYNATGMPAEYYRYPSDKVRQVGVMLAAAYGPVSPAQQREFKAEIGVPADAQLLFVTGATNGGRNINLAMKAIVPRLMEQHPKLHIVHQVGVGKGDAYGDYTHPRLQVMELVEGMHRYSGAADLVVSRCSATNMAEFGVQGKPCIAVPNPLLTGGHQLKNAEYLLQQEAVVVLDDRALPRHPELLEQAIEDLLDDAQKREQLAKKLQQVTPTDATQQLADMLLEIAG